MHQFRFFPVCFVLFVTYLPLSLCLLFSVFLSLYFCFSPFPNRYERIFGFYKGLAAYLLHVTPNICIVFLIYEHVTNIDDPPGQVPVSKPLSAPSLPEGGGVGSGSGGILSIQQQQLQELRKRLRKRQDGTYDLALDDSGYLDDDNDTESGKFRDTSNPVNIDQRTAQEILDGTNCLDET